MLREAIQRQSQQVNWYGYLRLTLARRAQITRSEPPSPDLKQLPARPALPVLQAECQEELAAHVGQAWKVCSGHGPELCGSPSVLL